MVRGQNFDNNELCNNILLGFCQKRGELCRDIEIQPTCKNITCKHTQYFCNPKGCISKDLPCFGKCPSFGSIRLTSCGSKCVDEDKGESIKNKMINLKILF